MYMCVLGINFVYFYDLFDQILNVLRQYGILSISMICLIRFWKFSDIMVFCLFLWSVWSDFECSQTVWYFVYFYDLFDQILNVLRQYGILCFLFYLHILQLRKNIPCHLNNVSCGLPCNKVLPCQQHKCLKTCHAVSII